MGITHVIPSLDLALAGVKFEQNVLISGKVVNGMWMLRRSGDKWQCLSSSSDRVITTFPVLNADSRVLAVPEHMRSRHYNEVLAAVRDTPEAFTVVE